MVKIVERERERAVRENERNRLSNKQNRTWDRDHRLADIGPASNGIGPRRPGSIYNALISKLCQFRMAEECIFGVRAWVPVCSCKFG